MKANEFYRDFVGEALGTFILVFFGCGTVAVTILFDAHSGLLQVAIVWGLAVTLAIYSTRHLSCAHLNPAVSLAMVAAKRMGVAKLPAYLLGQFGGALIAALVVYLLFGSTLTQYEAVHQIIRGSAESIKTAMIFGEFFPNPGAGAWVQVTPTNAFFAEAFGTAILVLLIFSLTEDCNVGRPDDKLAPLFIGATVAMIIAVIAPLTQAGLNPARDLSPRLVAYFAGWGQAAFPAPDYSFLTVYVLGPIAGGLCSAAFFTKILSPLMKNASDLDQCINC